MTSFQLVENKGTATQFLDGSNRFYTLIPHDFGMKKPPMLDTKEIIKVTSSNCFIIIATDRRGYQHNIFIYFSTKTYVVG